jgi:hypothetical protein
MDPAPTILSIRGFPVQQKSRLGELLDVFRSMQRGSTRRARRVLILVLAIWVLMLFDLDFTLLACRIGGFEELNPLAQQFLGSEQALVIYKFALTLPATAIILLLRRKLLTEIGCWTLFAAHLALTAMWVSYYSLL